MYIVVSIVLIFFAPLWIVLIINALLATCISNRLLIPVGIVQLIISTLLCSSVDVTGDLSNYSLLYSNIDNEYFRYEFYSEPFILYIFSLFNSLGVEFKVLLQTTSLIINGLLLIYLIKFGKYDFLRFFILLLTYPIYFQTQLYLYRQSLAVCLLLIALIVRSFGFKIFFLLLSVFSHSSSILYLLMLAFSKMFKPSIYRTHLIVLFMLALALPITVEMLTSFLSGFSGISYALNRKLDFFLRQDELDVSIKIYSTLLIPLHLAFLLLIKTKKKIDLKPITFLFLSLYYFALFFRDYSILPTRISYPILWLSPLFIYLLSLEQDFKIKLSHRIVLSLLICFSIFRFVGINDSNKTNIPFRNNDIETYSIFEYFGDL
ncbi:EpsG family protein [Vibrio pelagius]|uniref:EpsG family protein n=1 Tax=Vibrio pelagius TaxID=28169 RepID=UPI003B831479